MVLIEEKHVSEQRKPRKDICSKKDNKPPLTDSYQLARPLS
jgi:hypothetical protein